MAETAEGNSESKNGNKPTAVKHIKMIVIGDLKSKTIDEKVTTSIDMDSIVSEKGRSDVQKPYSERRILPFGHMEPL